MASLSHSQALVVPMFHWQPIIFHCTTVLFSIHFSRRLLTEPERQSFHFPSNTDIWIKKFWTNSFPLRSVTHVSDNDQFHFPNLVNWLFYIAVSCLFTTDSELWICVPHHQIHLTPVQHSCDYITASRAGQKALFRMSIDILLVVWTINQLWAYRNTLFHRQVIYYKHPPKGMGQP